MMLATPSLEVDVEADVNLLLNFGHYLFLIEYKVKNKHNNKDFHDFL